MARRVVLLDRDGTLIVERHYLSDPQQVELLPGVDLALRELRRKGFSLVVITNQSAIGRRWLDRRCLQAIHQRLQELLVPQGVWLDGIYFCPHRPEDGCGCRKPKPGLVERAVRELNFDPRTSWMIGDQRCDLELGRAVGATTCLVRTGYGAQVAPESHGLADYVVDTLQDIVSVIEGFERKERVVA